MIFVTNDERMGNNIRCLRQKRGITCEELARLVGISFRELHDIEEGRQWEIHGDTLKNICEYFHISVDALVESVDI